ncbi:hypothetical protein M9458_015488, partial [Cirrhinus mrigala]
VCAWVLRRGVQVAERSSCALIVKTGAYLERNRKKRTQGRLVAAGDSPAHEER